MRKLSEYFDVYNADHLLAFSYHTKKGHWSKEFWDSLPKDVEAGPNDILEICVNMARAWTNAAISGKVEGIPAVVDENGYPF